MAAERPAVAYFASIDKAEFVAADLDSTDDAMLVADAN
jgi:hypothetical protein